MCELLTTRRSTRWVLILICMVMLYTLFLSLTRIYQVDEAQNVFMARVTAMGRQQHYYTNGSLILLGPLTWITGHARTSEGMFSASRLIFYALYWLNMALIPYVAGLRLRDRAYPWILLLVAILPPLMDYGLEIRHDNVLLLLMLLFWAVLRCFKGSAWIAFALLGGIACIMQFTAFKAFLYWIPLSATILAFPPPSMEITMVKRGMAWLGGLFLALLILRLWYGAAGAWTAYMNGLHTAFGISDAPLRFPPWNTLSRLISQTPLLLGVGAAITITAVHRIRATGWRSLGWEGSGPEGLLFLLTLLAFLANPNPYPYNLLHLVPFLCIWIVRSLCVTKKDYYTCPQNRDLRAIGYGLLVFCYVVPSAQFASRHLNWTNDRQQFLMRTAESLTDQGHDRVFDAVGLLPTRESVGYQWFLHTLVMERFRNGTLVPLWRQFELNPPEVLIRNYRTNWMGRDEQAFIGKHYLPLADDLLVLGGLLPTGNGFFPCLHAGRYWVARIDPERASVESGDVWVDGQRVQSGGVIVLPEGSRAIRSQGSNPVQILWLGPMLSTPPRIPNQDHGLLFVNWY